MKKLFLILSLFTLSGLFIFVSPSLADTRNFTASNVTWDGTTLNFDTDVDMTTVPSGDPGPYHNLYIFNIGDSANLYWQSLGGISCTSSHCTVTGLASTTPDTGVSQVQFSIWDGNDEFVGQSQSNVPWTPVPPLTPFPTSTPTPLPPTPTETPTPTPTIVPPTYYTVDVTHAFVSGYPNENSFGQGAFFTYNGQDLSSYQSQGFSVSIQIVDENGNIIDWTPVSCSSTSCTAIDIYPQESPTTPNVTFELTADTTPRVGSGQIIFSSLPVSYADLTSQNGADIVSALPIATPTPVPTYTLSGTVYNDDNQNGVQDSGEQGYQGATVTLNTGQTTTTDANGNYTFTNLEAGTYTEILSVPSGYTATTTNPATVAVSTNTTQNFGIFSQPIVGAITVPSNTVKINTSLSTNASFTDGDTTDIHTASWSWGDGTTSNGAVTENNGSGSVVGSHTYIKLGSYTITVTIIDNEGLSSTSQLVVSVIPANGLAGGNLSHANYSGADLSSQNLSQANLSVATLNDVDFQSANLSQVNGSNSSFTNDNFIGANLNKVNLSNSNLSGSNFTNAIITQGNLSNVNLTNVNFTGANLQGANLSGTTRTGIIWSNTTCPNGANSNNHNGSCAGQGGGL